MLMQGGPLCPVSARDVRELNFQRKMTGATDLEHFLFFFFGYSCILELSLAVGIRADRNIPRYKYMLSQAGTVGKRQPKALFFFFCLGACQRKLTCPTKEAQSLHVMSYAAAFHVAFSDGKPVQRCCTAERTIVTCQNTFGMATRGSWIRPWTAQS